jgi:hypothetical protein
MSRVEDVLYADTLTKNPSLAAQSYRNRPKESSPSNICDDVDHWNSAETPNSKTLLDFMGWNFDHGAIDHMKKMNNTMCEMDNYLKEENDKHKSKIVNVVTTKKMSYLERLENLSGLRSPTARH